MLGSRVNLLPSLSVLVSFFLAPGPLRRSLYVMVVGIQMTFSGTLKASAVAKLNPFCSTGAPSSGGVAEDVLGEIASEIKCGMTTSWM